MRILFFPGIFQRQALGIENRFVPSGKIGFLNFRGENAHETAGLLIFPP
jgi:hypothetical protein